MPKETFKKQNEVDDIFSSTESASKTQPISNLKRATRAISAGLGGQRSISQSENSGNSGGSGWGKKILIMAVVVIVASAGAALAWFLLSKSPAGTPGVNNISNINENQPTGETLKNTGGNYVNQKIDADTDGLTNEEEKKLGTDPNKADSDNDDLLDREEVKTYQTDPLNPDTDGDGYKDGEEVRTGNNPKGPGRLFEIPKK
ncbi:MAG: hypothetical protein V1892_02865 [bacterium]